MGYIVSQRYRDPQLGSINIVVRANARSARARWKGQELQITLPERVTVKKYKEILNSWRESLMQAKPQSRYYDGQRFDFEGFSIVIEASLERANQLSCDPRSKPCLVRVSKDIDFSKTAVEKAISNAICYISRAFAKELVLDVAADQSKSMGIYPAKYYISNGARTLGHCSHSKEIALSSRLAFLPEELRRYVICHELAHLVEMNHSPRFHTLVNIYTNGREAELERKLRKFQWPIIR
jgi:predicted metal-dependent hydrolase